MVSHAPNAICRMKKSTMIFSIVGVVILIPFAFIGFLAWAMMRTDSYETPLAKIDLPKGFYSTKSVEIPIPKDAMGTSYRLTTMSESGTRAVERMSPAIRTRIYWKNVSSKSCQIADEHQGPGMHFLQPGEKTLVAEGTPWELIQRAGRDGILTIKAEPLQVVMCVELEATKPLDEEVRLDVLVFHFVASP